MAGAVKFFFRFFRWYVRISIIRREDYAGWLREMVSDVILYGEGVVRVAPDDRLIVLKNPLFPDHDERHHGFQIIP